MSGQKSISNLLKSVTIVGLGNIGLPLAVLAALKGYKVFGVDIDPLRLEKIRTLDDKAIEPAVVFFLQDQQVIDNLQLQTFVQSKTDFIVMCVNTPVDENFQPNMKIVQDATLALAPFLKVGSVLIIESTTTVGFTRKMSADLEKLTGMVAGKDFFVAYTPERLLPGQAFRELIFNDRVIGGINSKSSDRAMEFYVPMIKGECLRTSAEVAELTKIIENSHRAVEIAFANEVFEIAKELNIDPFDLIELANRHPRVKIANPGIGVGGDCVPVHPHFLKSSLVKGLPDLLDKALKLNQERDSKIIQEVSEVLQSTRLKNVQKKRKPIVLLFGLTYKPNVLDLRNSPALKIAQKLSLMPEIDLRVYDPLIDRSKMMDLGLESLECYSEYKIADVLVFLVAHDKFALFKDIDLSEKVCVDPIGFLRKPQFKSLKKEATVS